MPLLLQRLVWVCVFVCKCVCACVFQCVDSSVHSHTSDLSHQWQVICLSGGDDLMRQVAAFLVCSCRLYPHELLVNDTCGTRPENCTHSMFLKCCFQLITTLLHVQNKRWQATVITMKELFFFFFGHPSSQKYNQLLNWGVFSSKVFHNKWLWHKECQRWTPSHNRFPAQAPVMALCVTASSPAGPAKWAKQAVNQPASDSTRNQTRRSVSQLLRVSYSLRRPRPFSAQCDEKGGRALQPGP